jgi:hypothetical protein
LELLGLPESISTNRRVCSNHFDPSDFQLKADGHIWLKPDVYPQHVQRNVDYENEAEVGYDNEVEVGYENEVEIDKIVMNNVSRLRILKIMLSLV